MCGIIEVGQCYNCGYEGPINRKYYYYNVECECCSNKENKHFEIVRYCDDCEPKAPDTITIKKKSQ